MYFSYGGIPQDKHSTTVGGDTAPMSFRRDPMKTVSTREIIDLIAYAREERYLHQLDFEALDGVQFNNEQMEEQQHLDIGCGTGSFTRSVLLPLSRPCRRFVAADVSGSMLDFARRQNNHADIVYDLLDIDSAQEVSSFVDKYGFFNRIYSLLCFHLVADETAAFRNIAMLLSTGGQCLVSACVFHPALDAWADVYKMPEWNSLVPDPAVVLPSAVRFHYSGTLKHIENETRRRVDEAGLQCLMCDVKLVTWHFEDIGRIFEMYSDDFKISVALAPRQRADLKRDFTEFLRPRVTQAASGCEVNVGIYRVLAKLR